MVECLPCMQKVLDLMIPRTIKYHKKFLPTQKPDAKSVISLTLGPGYFRIGIPKVTGVSLLLRCAP